MAGWFVANDAATLAHAWPDVDLIDPGALGMYLAAAKAACLAYAPALPEGATDIPDEYRLAQALQARNTWNASAAGPSGANDGSSYGLTAFPLDWQVKQLLRPEQGTGAFVW